MYILAIDTATGQGSIAIFQHDKLLINHVIDKNLKLAEHLINELNKTLAEIKLNINDIDLLFCNIGPGMFTALRVGISASVGLAMAMHKPIYGVSSFQTIVYHVQNNYETTQDITILLDAKRDEYYYQSFNNNILNPINQGRILESVEIDDLYNQYIVTDSDKIKSDLIIQHNALMVGQVGYYLYNNQPDLLLPAQPLYIKPPDAKIGKGKIIKNI